ncbi:aminoacyl-tRNA hydrolase [Schizosaccharomyces japonicus yFS275]|uniref:peptidyl-tRNA hydrolase n=1 Tax=Schizosaccharomyces japonicus (strain yFS275 / FY16936) TaxID=402676 RepID=B6K8D0_SCHJY|nr:aminoacyl-tRNA hydrolase [Schizosaccharomyces japonicus yFS275]EEB09784.1 aminoacyl-tRNA hydrolase [Schizosaccharomyces japonicus yFS275]
MQLSDISSWATTAVAGIVLGFLMGRTCSCQSKTASCDNCVKTRKRENKIEENKDTNENSTTEKIGKEEEEEEEEEEYDEFEMLPAKALNESSPLYELARSEGQAKMVLVVRTDLGMTKGKVAAQCAHAALACYRMATRVDPKLLQFWERTGQAKIALQAHSEEELELLQAQALSLGLCAYIIHDAGRTQIASGSATVLGIGPGPISVVNQVTGKLRLF